MAENKGKAPGAAQPPEGIGLRINKVGGVVFNRTFANVSGGGMAGPAKPSLIAQPNKEYDIGMAVPLASQKRTSESGVKPVTQKPGPVGGTRTQPKVYVVDADMVPATVRIFTTEEEFVPIYSISFPSLDPKVISELDSVRNQLISEVRISMEEILVLKKSQTIRDKFFAKAVELISRKFPRLDAKSKDMYAYWILHQMLGLGLIEVMLADEAIEEIVINGTDEPVWVYHKSYGWMKSNITIDNEEDIYNYAAAIGRRSGREITDLKPLMDTHLMTGDRVNATLNPISIQGNTLTIRKFPRKPFTITDFVRNNTADSSLLSLIWLATEYEASMIIAGGTATGKTSFLNAISAFIPPNQRVISIEDTKELNLPKYLHWVPMLVREPNPEGKGEISMLDLMVNSLRMRPDRIIVGEIRRHEEAQVLFEAMHTGHSVMATLHAFNSNEALTRLTNPPIDIDESMIAAVDMFLILERLRKEGIRKLTEVSEIVPNVGEDDKYRVSINPLFKFHIKTGELVNTNPSKKVILNVRELSGMSFSEIKKEMYRRKLVIDWVVEKNINTVNTVGKAVAEYYKDPDKLLSKIEAGTGPAGVLGSVSEELRH
jgi:archaeal flagellar protein FlaI